ncbi:MAG: ABC transporter ATP-binding protein [Lachnospiraceae bacterium]|nr:ABC transporter ATP-binding protein [Lachnospiraceae bacterium]
MKKLLVYLKDYKLECVLAPLFKMLEAFFELLVPLVMASIIDRGIADRDISYILRMGTVLLALAAVGLISSVTAQFFAAKAAVGFSAGLRQALFNHIQGLDYTNIDKVGTSTLITRMTADINQLQNGVNMVLRLFLRSPIIVFGATIMAFTIDLEAALVFVVAIPVLAAVVYGVMFGTRPLYRRVQEKLDRVLSITRDNLNGVRVIRAFAREDEELKDFYENNNALSGLQKFVGKISALTNPVTYVIINLAIIILIYHGAIQVDSGILTQGEVVALINYMSQILVELVKLASLIILLTKALASGDRVLSVFEVQNGSVAEVLTQKISLHNNLPFIQFDHVHLTYDGAGDETLTDIDFSVNRGDTVGIIGGTGSGKTSLVNLIPAFYRATKGNIFIDGRNVNSYDEEELRKKIGVVPQKAVLFKGTIKDNLKWGNPDATEDDLWEALELSQAKEVVEGKGGLNGEVTQNGKNFSGGQRQRLTIARALIRHPEILILDDSSSALDYATDARLRAALISISDRTTIFIVSQRTTSIMHADRIIVLDDGHIAGTGSHDELLKGCDIYREIHNAGTK